MADFRCEIEGVNVVLRGHFNPKIFQPTWFAHHGLIRIEEAEAAENLVSIPELTTFTSDWFRLQVTPDRFEASTADAAHFETLRDLVLGTFSLLEHTPFDQMGMNRIMHYKMPSEERYHGFGHFLVPKEPWRDILTDPRTRSLTIEGFQMRGSSQVKLAVKIEPSSRVEFGVFISTNEHHQVSGEDTGRQLMTALQKYWKEAQAAAKRIANHLLEQTS
jgi:hypothetical protein